MYTYEPEAIEELVQGIQDVSQEYEVRPVYEKVPPSWWGGHPVYEVIALWVPWEHIATGAAAGIANAMAQRALDWLLKRPWLPAPAPPGSPSVLPKGVYIYGPRGEILQTVEVRHPGAEPIYGDRMYPGHFSAPGDRSRLREWPPEDYGKRV
jgi:hypothetical protein